MDLLIGLSPLPTKRPLSHRLPHSSYRKSRHTTIRASSSSKPPSPLVRTLKTTVSGAIILAASSAALLSGKARAEPSAPPPAAEERIELTNPSSQQTESESASLSEVLDSNTELTNAHRDTIYTKLEESTDDMEALSFLRRLITARPLESEWKLLTAQLLSELGDFPEARKLLEEVLASDPLSLEALFENAIVMEHLGEGTAVQERLQQALDLAREENKEKEAREIRLIMAQVQFLQEKLEEALASYEELANEDPKDFRPVFTQGMILTILERNKEAKEKFAKFKELSRMDFRVETYLHKGLSRIRLFEVEDSKK